MRQRCFCDCSLSDKLLYTAFLFIIGIGYLMALTYLYTSHQGHDGKPGLSIEDVAETYYGNRSAVIHSFHSSEYILLLLIVILVINT